MLIILENIHMNNNSIDYHIQRHTKINNQTMHKFHIFNNNYNIIITDFSQEHININNGKE